MTVSNDKIVHSCDDRDIEDDHSLNHSDDYGNHVHFKDRRLDRISDISNWRKHSFSVILPRKLANHSDSDLKLMLVSLKNVTIATSVHIGRIERELRNRGNSLTILGK